MHFWSSSTKFSIVREFSCFINFALVFATKTKAKNFFLRLVKYRLRKTF